MAPSGEAITPHAVFNVPKGVSLGRFSGDHHWPLLVITEAYRPLYDPLAEGFGIAYRLRIT
jgi:hypothetical protein